MIETVDIVADGHKRFAVAKYGDIVVMERVPLHVMDLPIEQREFFLVQIAKKLKAKLLNEFKRRQGNVKHDKASSTETVRAEQSPCD